MSKFLLPVPTHSVGTDVITVQYDRAMIPILTGLLQTHGKLWAFDPDTGDTVEGEYYVDTLATQLLEELSMNKFVRIHIDPEELLSISGNLLRRPINVSPTSNYITYSFQVTSSAATDEYYIDLVLPDGNYKVNMRYSLSPNSGIYQVGFDDDTPFTINAYAASNVPHTTYGGTQAYLTEGTHRFRVKCVGKHASSTDYYLIVEYFLIERIMT